MVRRKREREGEREESSRRHMAKNLSELEEAPVESRVRDETVNADTREMPPRSITIYLSQHGQSIGEIAS